MQTQRSDQNKRYKAICIFIGNFNHLMPKKVFSFFQDIMYFLAEWRTPATHFYSQFSPPGIYINPTSSQTTPNMAKYESNPKR